MPPSHPATSTVCSSWLSWRGCRAMTVRWAGQRTRLASVQRGLKGKRWTDNLVVWPKAASGSCMEMITQSSSDLLTSLPPQPFTATAMGQNVCGPTDMETIVCCEAALSCSTLLCHHCYIRPPLWSSFQCAGTNCSVASKWHEIIFIEGLSWKFNEKEERVWISGFTLLLLHEMLLASSAKGPSVSLWDCIPGISPQNYFLASTRKANEFCVSILCMCVLLLPACGDNLSDNLTERVGSGLSFASVNCFELSANFLPLNESR